MIFITSGPEETVALGRRIGQALEPGNVIALRGGLAAGKTTLVKGIALGLDIDEEVTSPSYTLISEYSGRLPLYHMDAYRLDGDEDFVALGAEEYLFGHGVSVVEWSERVEASMPRDAAVISLGTLGDGSRRIEISGAFLEAALK